MKNTILHWTSVLLASAALMLSGCTSSDEETPEVTTPVFPELATLTIPAGETFCEVTFTPNMDWTVSIPTDAETSRWFKLSDGVMESTSISGRASSEPVTVQVTTIDQESFDLSPVCEVSLTMGGQTKVIAQVTRGTAAREFELYLSKYSTDDDDFIMPYEFDETPLAKYDGTEAPTTAPEGTAELKWPIRIGEPMQVVKGSSNFDWLISAPEWIEVSSPTAVEGEADSKQFFVTALFNKLTEDQLDGAVAMLDIYDSNIADIETPGANAHNRYCFTLPALRNIVRHRMSAMNGTTFSFTKEGQQVDTNGTVLEDTPCTGDVYSAAGLKFYVAVQDDRGFYYTGMNPNTQENMTDWVTIEDTWDENGSAFQQHTYTVSVTENTGESREAILIALPKAMADKITQPDYQLFNMDGTELLDEYKPYQFATVEQAGTTAEEEGFSIEVNSSTSHMVGEGLAATFVKVDSEQYFYDHMDDSYLINYYEYFMNGVPIYVLTFNSAAAEDGGVLFDIKSAYDNATIPAADTWLHAEYMPDDYNPGWTMMMIDMSKGQANAKSNITFTNANGSQTYAILLCYRNY